MSCQTSEELLSAYADEELTLMDQASLQEHLAGCVACQKRLSALVQMKDILRRRDLPRMPLDLRSAIEQKTFLWKPWWKRELQARVWFPVVLSLAATAVFLLLRWSASFQPDIELAVARVPHLFGDRHSTRIVLHHEPPPESSGDCRDDARGC